MDMIQNVNVKSQTHAHLALSLSLSLSLSLCSSRVVRFRSSPVAVIIFWTREDFSRLRRVELIIPQTLWLAARTVLDLLSSSLFCSLSAPCLIYCRVLFFVPSAQSGFSRLAASFG